MSKLYNTINIIQQIEEYKIKQNQIITKLIRDELGEDIDNKFKPGQRLKLTLLIRGAEKLIMLKTNERDLYKLIKNITKHIVKLNNPKNKKKEEILKEHITKKLNKLDDIYGVSNFIRF